MNVVILLLVSCSASHLEREIEQRRQRFLSLCGVESPTTAPTVLPGERSSELPTEHEEPITPIAAPEPSEEPAKEVAPVQPNDKDHGVVATIAPPCTAVSTRLSAIDTGNAPTLATSVSSARVSEGPRSSGSNEWSPKFFVDNGYDIMRNVLDPEIVAALKAKLGPKYVDGHERKLDSKARTRASAHADRSTGADSRSEHQLIVDLFYKSPAFERINKMMGGSAVRNVGAQIAVINPSEPPADFDPRTWRPDHQHGPNSSCHVDGPSFSILVGIALFGSEEKWTGNLGVLPGAHKALAASSQEASQVHNAITSRMRPGDYHQMCVGDTDVYIAHYLTPHCPGPNYRGRVPRVAVYFRIGVEGYDHAANYPKDRADLWKHFPGIPKDLIVA